MTRRYLLETEGDEMAVATKPAARSVKTGPRQRAPRGSLRLVRRRPASPPVDEPQRDSLVDAGFRILAHASVPRSDTTFGLIAIGPTGVFLVEVIDARGRLVLRGEDLFVHGRRRNKTVEELVRKAHVLREALGDALAFLHAEVRPVLAVRGPAVPWGDLQMRGVTIVDHDRLAATLRREPKTLGSHSVGKLADLAGTRLAHR